MKKAVWICLVLMMALLMPLSAKGVPEVALDLSAPVKLTIWTHEDANRSKLEKQLISEFTAQNPNVTVDYQTYPSGKMRELLTVAFSANQGPDIFNQSQSVIRQFVVEGRTSALNPAWIGEKSLKDITDRYIPGALEAVEFEGGIYGMPLEYTNLSMYVNKQIFRDAGLDAEKDYPKTWEDMVKISQKLVIRQGDILVRRGFDFRYPYYLVAFLPMIEQLGGQLISDDGKTAIVNDAAWLKFLTYMQQWGPSGLNLGSPTYKNARNLFNKNNNDIGMATTGLYQIGRIKAENPAFYDSKEWMVVPFPVFENAVKDVAASFYGHYYMVNAQSSKATQDAAWKFIAFMLSHAEEYLTEVSLIQPTKALMASAAYKDVPYSEVFTKDFERGHIVYYGKSSAEFQTLIRSAVESVMLSGVTPAKALATLKTAAQELLDEQ